MLNCVIILLVYIGATDIDYYYQGINKIECPTTEIILIHSNKKMIFLHGNKKYKCEFHGVDDYGWNPFHFNFNRQFGVLGADRKIRCSQAWES